MRELWNRITNRLGWFIGFLIVSGIIIFFIWSVFDRKGFTTSVNEFLKDSWAVCEYLIKLFLIFLALYLLYRAVRGDRRGGGRH